MSALSPDEQALLDLIPDDESVGNRYLRDELGWDEDRYWRARNGLVAKSCIAIGRGQGGSVRKTDTDVQALVEALPPSGEAVRNAVLQEKLDWSDERYWAAQQKARRQRLVEVGRGRGGLLWRRWLVDETAPEIERTGEGALYEPIRTVLLAEWAKSQNLEQYVCEITAYQGRKDTGGLWTRPDLALVSFRRFSLLPYGYFDIYTFEVKTREGWSLAGVHEALAHGRFATRPYAFFETEDGGKDLLEDRYFGSCLEEAQRIGVGLISATDVDDFATWTTHCDPVRREPDPEAMQKFLEDQLSMDGQDQIREWTS